MRVTFFLVAETQKEVNAVREVVNHLLSQYFALVLYRDWELPVTGFTHSAIHDVALKKDPIFVGHWWSGEIDYDIPLEDYNFEGISLSEEKVVLFVVDLPSVAEEWKLDEGIRYLKEDIFSIYKKYKRAQKEIWIMKQDIYRYV